MTTAIVPANELGLIPQEQSDFAVVVASNTKFPPYVKLYGAQTEEVKDGSFPMGHFGLIFGQEPPVDIGKEFDCVPLAWRPKAVRLEPQTIIFDQKHAEYAAIRDDAEAAKGQMIGCMHGPEFLLWIPAQQELALYHLCSATARREAANFNKFLLKPISVKSKLIKNKKFSWHGPTVLSCSTPLDSVPLTADNRKVVEVFQNPKNVIPEVAQEDSRSR